ncbi:GntR family transcriptional regulator [Pseudovibrio japonicus]|uniref:GntR family transcriptional regulator n=1 Tax=Pseudovibrio japonicus TaxID=366534 RepID=A0ABQ3E7S0_9HYPH|nr:GntR family transcriptional regulator [Pseudovibrio japonicus]GHB26177.1 GntR family transcriptional regulator [Pseudovibrio japonicus]
MTANSPNGAEIYRRLIKAIETRELKPGSRLREAELAEKFGVSRTPIREGLKRLEAQGLAVHEPNRGMVIPSLDHNQISELYFLREVLEGTAGRLAAQHASAAEIEILQEMVESDMQNLADADRLIKTNREFHRRFYLASHNRYLVEQIDHMRLSLLLLAGTTLTDDDRRRLAIEEHAEIVDAISKRDCDRADRAARHHIAEAHKARLKFFTQLT